MFVRLKIISLLCFVCFCCSTFSKVTKAQKYEYEVTIVDTHENKGVTQKCDYLLSTCWISFKLNDSDIKTVITHSNNSLKLIFEEDGEALFITPHSNGNSHELALGFTENEIVSSIILSKEHPLTKKEKERSLLINPVFRKNVSIGEINFTAKKLY